MQDLYIIVVIHTCNSGCINSNVAVIATYMCSPFMYNSCNEFWELESKILSGFEVKFVWLKGRVQFPIILEWIHYPVIESYTYLKFPFFSIGSMNLFLMAVPCSYYIWH